MTNLKTKAAEVAKAGRFADDVLIHMSRAEVEGLASLMPNGKLPLNPKTGLPEAFFFLPFLAGLGAAGATAGTAAATGALGAGLTAGMGAAAGGLGALTGAGATAAGLGAGTAAGLGAAGTGALTAASALPAATAGLGAAGGLAAGATGAAMPALAGGTTALSALPVTGASGLGGALAGAPLAGTGATGALGSGITAAGTAAGPGAAAASPLAASPLATGAASAGTGALASAAPAVTTATTKAGLGGLLGGMDMGQMLQYGALASMMMPQGGGGGGEEDEGKDLEGQNYEAGEAEFPDDGGNSGGTSGEFDYFPRSRYFASGGLVKGYAEGGLASLDKMSGGMGDEELVQATVLALQGQTPNADAIIQQFIATFGKEALQDLVSRVQQGGAAQGDGMSDSVPAMINGAGGAQQPAQLSEGEYIIPSDVVSGIGNGSTDAGAQQLQGMVDRTRMMRNGGMVQPPAINPRMVMPA